MYRKISGNGPTFILVEKGVSYIVFILWIFIYAHIDSNMRKHFQIQATLQTGKPVAKENAWPLRIEEDNSPLTVPIC